MELFAREEEMPKSCSECPIKHYEKFNMGMSRNMFCSYHNRYLGSDMKNYKKREKDCPLKSLPRCECEELKEKYEIERKFRVEFERKLKDQWELSNERIQELQDKLAVCERALKIAFACVFLTDDEDGFGWYFGDSDCDKNRHSIGVEELMKIAIAQATAELKAEKGEENV